MVWTRKQIDGMAELIKLTAIGGTLFDILITETDINILLIAAYLFGKQSADGDDANPVTNEPIE